MNTQSFTTSSAVAGIDNVVVSEDVAPDVRDFLLLCKDGNIAEVVHALYYLPQNYKVMIMGDAAHPSQNQAAWMDNFSLKDRIQFENMETAENQESPYLFADAIISDDADAETVKSADAPYVVVSTTANDGLTINGANGFTVQAGNPEALASAILHISRKN